MSLRMRFILSATVLVVLAVGIMGWFAVETIEPDPIQGHVNPVIEALQIGLTIAQDSASLATMADGLGTYRESAALKRPKRKRLIAGAVLLALLLIAISIVASWIAATRWTRPIREMAKATIKISRGRLETVEESGGTREMRALVDSFDRMVHSLRDSREKLARAERRAAWQDIARAIAHEIKNPLTPMRLTTQRLREKFAESPQDFAASFIPSTDIVLSEIDRLERLANAFSSFAAMPPPEPRSIDMASTVRGIGELFAKDVESGRLQLVIPGYEIGMEADPHQIQQMLINLIKNGLEAISDQEDGWVRVLVDDETDSTNVLIKVSDNGPGIEPEMLPELFKPYMTTKEDGTGIGLAIVERVVSDHGGTVSAQVNEVGGALFKVSLPWRRSSEYTEG